VSDVMSHIITIEAKYKNLSVIKEVCESMNVQCVKGVHDFAWGSKVEGYKVYLKNWYEPIVIKEDGTIIYDDMTEKFQKDDKVSELTKFKNMYCLKETERLLKKQNLKYKIYESDDEIKIEVSA